MITKTQKFAKTPQQRSYWDALRVARERVEMAFPELTDWQRTQLSSEIASHLYAEWPAGTLRSLLEVK